MVVAAGAVEVVVAAGAVEVVVAAGAVEVVVAAGAEVVVSLAASTLIVSGVTVKSSASPLAAPLHLERDICSLPEEVLSALTNGSVRMVNTYSPSGVFSGISSSASRNAYSYAQLTVLAHAVVFASAAATPSVLPSLMLYTQLTFMLFGEQNAIGSESSAA